MFRKTWPVAIISPLVVLGAPASAVENQSQTIECVGVLRSHPVHVSDIDNPRLKAGHGGLVADTGGKQSKDCDQSFDSENWKKVRDACHEDKLCRVVGVIGPSGWKCVIKAEDYSEAGQKVKEARTAPSLEPFLFFSDLEGSYQGSGWLKHDLLVGCHKVEGKAGK